MIIRILILINLFVFSSFSAKTIDEVDVLLEKVHHAKDADEKKELIEQLKKKLAQKNKKAQEEAEAIINAKKKVPMRTYDESVLENR